LLYRQGLLEKDPEAVPHHFVPIAGDACRGLALAVNVTCGVFYDEYGLKSQQTISPKREAAAGTNSFLPPSSTSRLMIADLTHLFFYALFLCEIKYFIQR